MVLDVLVVDDSDLIRKMILKTLRMAEVPLGAVYEAGNGREALGILQENWVDLVLADLNMPIMDGVEMLRRMREIDELRTLPVIVVSSEGAASRRPLLQEMGVTAYVRKPFTPEMLRDVVTGFTTDWGQEERADLVEELFVRVLQQFTFSYGEPVDPGELPEPAGQLLCAKMTFAGARGGLMALAAPLDAARAMVANVLGNEAADIGVIDAADALGEVLNMACGHITAGLDERDVIDLSPPEIYGLEIDEWRRLARGAHAVGFIVDERPVLLAIGMR